VAAEVGEPVRGAVRFAGFVAGFAAGEVREPLKFASRGGGGREPVRFAFS
jgi:hypothetical protein